MGLPLLSADVSMVRDGFGWGLGLLWVANAHAGGRAGDAAAGRVGDRNIAAAHWLEGGGR